ncbi:putative membrane protein [Streptococcus gordonii]|uniref:Putative membrane protein n=1 Tax=Streptococcus gordonii TaxID=1302 RepID=A0A139N602_STRGN|nr:putative membrane protein [Streptococcus gordonii]
MKKGKKLVVLLLLWILVLWGDWAVLSGVVRFSLLEKLILIGGTGIGLFFATWGILKSKQNGVRERKIFSIKEKLNGVLVLSASSIYTLGIWLSTPSAGLLKEIVMGIGLLVQLVFLGYFILRKADEEADERFYANLSKAAMTAFASSIIFLLTLALLLTIVRELYVPGGIFFIVAGVLVLLFNFVFMYLESRGA